MPQLIIGPKLMFAKRDKHYPSRSGQTRLATAVINFTKPVTKINSGPSIAQGGDSIDILGKKLGKKLGAILGHVPE